mmetsp:Transcript_132342/g.423451  ORF Transcript_132342/g.423451 Transcript_132342/m.423451 type:complete len:645 (-) Transcript_132342:49-1983(-)|eukprot:CAMPEP_0203916006 /NCGR_PEP_ID=MMETSP0359-20131031/56709_1 /ASSEMBLY_ACC=CAM_ASM_000338 /TAXON_ID=268821 /ORGANISM="Scrippsiella Hangoei, Strain SHTV-5" /LENGTH=644 /DNA_ID=CAMNT_0050842607 /DNA_START=100 /DNA_END=2034 /DNA_ORIENTATION=+
MWPQRVVALGRRCRGLAALPASTTPLAQRQPALEAIAPNGSLPPPFRCGADCHDSSGSAGARPSRPGRVAAAAAAAAALAAAGGAALGPAQCEGEILLSTSPPSSEHLRNMQGLSGHHLRNRMVTSVIGLPLRGKAHMARRLKRYLEFFHGFEVELFDVNEYSGPDGDQKLLEALKSFFEADDKGTIRAAKYVCSGRFAIIYTKDTHAARNSMWSGHSKWRRRWMSKTLGDELQAHSIFVEIQVDESTIHRKEYMDRLERARGLEPGTLEKTIVEFKKDYVTIQDDGTEDDLAYMKLLNYNHKVVTNNMMRSFLGSRIAQFLSSVHPYSRTVYISRHGESEYNVSKKLGGDSGLSPLGREYAPRLAEFAEYVICGGAEQFACFTISSKENKAEKLKSGLSRVPRGGQTGGIFAKKAWGAGVEEGMQLVRIQRGYGQPFEDAPHTVAELVEIAEGYSGPLMLVFVDSVGKKQECARLWTSSLRRTKETAALIRHPTVPLPGGKSWEQMSHRVYRTLDEVYAGEFEGLTYEEIKKLNPEDARLRKQDKLGYRYPRGESYYDIIARLDLPMNNLETYHEPTLIIGHQAIHRMVYAFLTGMAREKATEISIPLHTVIRLEYDGTGSLQETRYFLGPKRLDEDDGQSML